MPSMQTFLFNLCTNRLRRLQFNSRAMFERMAVNDWGQDDTSRITAYFHTPSVVISEGHALDLDATIAHLNERVTGFTCRGSGYALAWIK